MKQETDLAEKLFGNKRLETGSEKLTTTTIIGKALTDSENGYVEVEYDGNITYGDFQQNIVPTGPNVKAGDTVLITATGGVGKSMSVTNVQGWGDRIDKGILEVSALIAEKADIEYLEAEYAHITDGVIDNATIGYADVNGLNANYAHITNGAIDNAKIGYADVNGLNANYAHITNGAIDNAKIDYADVNDLEANYAHITSGVIDNAKIDHADVNNLDANYAHITNGAIDNATIGYADVNGLNANYAHITNGAIDNAKIGYADVNGLNANYAHITNGTIDNAKIGYADVNDLEANYAQIDFENVTNSWIENGVIRNGAIQNEMVQNVSASKLTAGTIDASKINVANLSADNLIVRRINGQPVVGGYTLIGATSPGYSSKNPSQEGWYELSNGAFVLTQDTSVQEGKPYYQEGDEVALYDQAYIDSMKNQLNQRIDGAVETFTGTAVPTLTNYPYNTWYDTSQTPPKDERASHVGDIYFVTNPALDQDGYSYRFAYDNTSMSYMWVLIKDSDVTKALSDITDLQDFESETISWQEETDEGLTVIRQNHTALSGVVDKTVKESVQLWFTKANTTAPSKPTAQVTSTSTDGNGWRTVVPAWNASYPNYYYCWQFKLADNTYAWSDVVRDIAMGESQGTSRSAQTTANANIKSSVQLWFTKANSTAPSKPTAQVTTNNAATGNAWNLAVPTYNASYPHYFYCYQQQKGDGTYQWSDVVYDKGTTEAMQKAQAALPSTTFTTFQSTTFKNLVDEVDEQSSTITQMTERVDGIPIGGKGRWFAAYPRPISEQMLGFKSEQKYIDTGMTENMAKDFAMRVDFQLTETGTRYCLASPYNSWPLILLEVTANSKLRIYMMDDTPSLVKDAVVGTAIDLNTPTTAVVWWGAEAKKITWLLVCGNRSETGEFTVSGTFNGTPTRTVRLGCDERVNNTWNHSSPQMDQPPIWYQEPPTNGDYICYWDLTETVAGDPCGVTPVSCVVGSGSVTTLTNTVNSVSQTATANTASITGLTTTTQSLQTTLNNINYDDTNLMPNSREMPFGATSYAIGRWRTAGNADMTKSRVEIDDGPSGHCGALQLVGTQTTQNDTSCFGIDSFPMEKGEIYEMSVYARVVSGTGMAGINCSPTPSYGKTLIDTNADGVWGTSPYQCINLDTSWKRVWVRFKAYAASGNLYIGGAGTNATIQMCMVRLVKSYATSSEMTTTVNKYNTMEQTLNGTVSRVGSLETQTSGLSSRMTSAETTISQTANNVLIKATESDTTAAQGGQHLIQSLINVAPSGVTISADKVNIEGAAIFTGSGRLSPTSLNNAYDSKGSASAVQTNLDNLKVGGANLLWRTFSPKMGGMAKGYWSKWIAGDTVEKTADGIKITCSSNSATSFRIPLAQQGSISVGDQLVLSFDYRGNLTGAGEVYMMCYPAPNISHTMTALVESTTNWVHFEQAFSFSGSPGGPSVQLMFPYRGVTGKWLEIKDGTLMLEKATKASSWQPSTADLVEYTDAALERGVNLAQTLCFGTVQTTQNVTCTGIGPTTIRLNGTSAAQGAPGNLIFRAPMLRPGKYCLWLTDTNNGNVWFHLGKGASNTHVYSASGNHTKDNPYVLDVTTADTYAFYPVFKSGVTFSNFETSYMLEKGEKATVWKPAPEDLVSKTQRIYYRTSSSTKPSAPSTWVTEAGNKWAANNTTATNWTTKVTPISNGTGASVTKYLYLWTCEQSVNGAGSLTNSAVLLDDTTTVINGGDIITGSVTANQLAANSVTAEQLNATSINASNMLTVGSMTTTTQSSILNSNIKVGSTNLLTKAQLAASSWTHTIANTTTMTGDGYENTWTMVRTGSWEHCYIAVPVTNGAEYTLSLDHQVLTAFDLYSTARPFVFQVCKAVPASGDTFSNVIASIPIGNVVSTVSRGSCTFTAVGSTVWFNIPGGYVKDGSTNVSFKFGHVKLEEGNVATSWEPPVGEAVADAQELQDFTIDLSASTYSDDTWYPVIISPDAPGKATRLRMDFRGEGGVPSWSAHNTKHWSASVDVTYYPSCWGWGPDNSSYLTSYDFGQLPSDLYPVTFSNVLSHSNKLVMYARGGAIYPVSVNTHVTPDVYTTTYSYDSTQSVAPVTTQPSNTSNFVVSRRQTQTNVENAAKTATTYVTHIDDNGITVHPSSTTNNRIAVNASGVELFKSNVSVAQYGETARIGRSNKARFEMGSSSLKAYDDNNAQYFEVSASGVKWGASLGSTAATTAALTTETNQRKAIYAKSTTAAGTAAKVTESGTPAGFVLYTGATVSITFTTANTTATPTLNVNATGAKTIKGYSGAALTEAEYKWAAGATIGFTYDGTYWRMQDGGALQAKADAASSASTATSKATAASNSATAAANSATAASGSASTASDKATAASNSATAAAGSASTASSKATAASNSATAAANSATAAASSATTASDKATAASNSATAAANSATEAANRDTAFFGTCGTAAGTQAKVVACTNFKSTNLKTGTTIVVRCSTAQTYVSAKITLNVNSTGAKDVYAGDAVTSATNQVLWAANAMVTFVYNGSQWVIESDPRNWFGACTTAAGTQAKAGTLNMAGAVVCKGTTVALQMSNANTHASPTLNVGSTAAKNLYIPGATTFPTVANGNSWFAGATVNFVFDGQYWRLQIPDSAKFATALTSNGVMVHKQTDTTTGVQITDQVDIVKSGNSVATFAADKIQLGKNAATSVIELCNGLGKITQTSNGDYWTNGLTMSSNSPVVMRWAPATATYSQEACVRAVSYNSNGIPYGNVFLEAGDSSERAYVAASARARLSGGGVSDSWHASVTLMGGRAGDVYSMGLGLAPVSLYDNESAAFSGSITLSETAANFTRLELFCKDNDGRYCYAQVWNPNGKTVNVTQTLSYGGNFYVKSRAFGISAKVIDTVATSGTYHSGEVNAAGNNTGSSTDCIKIVKVLGYR